MKKILKPAEREEAIYYSDFSGKLFPSTVPVTVKIECGYGSEYDGADVELHLSDTGLEKLLEFVRENLCPESKEVLERVVNTDCKNSDKDYNNVEIYKKLL